jgi:aminopeptidase-like protein
LSIHVADAHCSTASVPARSTATVGDEMYELAGRLYPICRSITGNGVRDTLRLLGEHVPLDVHEVPTGTPVFDWVVPPEWNVRDAYVKNSRGERIIDFQRSNLHVVSYSVPVHTRMSLAALRPHLHSLESCPDWIPYRTSYYQPTWGFCLSHRQLLALPEDEYEVCIDSTLTDGSLTYGETLVTGDTDEEVLISCHICHPSLGNDNLSGIVVAAFLARALAASPRRYSYRFLFVPGMIGPITWLAKNETQLHRTKHGLVLACIGDSGGFTYKRSRQRTADIDRAVMHVLQSTGRPYTTLEFSPYGYDERQYCSPGINLPVGCLMRTPHGEYPEYHTSADDLSLVRPEALAESLRICLTIADVLDGDGRYLNQSPKCEPQLGRRGLYGSMGGADPRVEQLALLWALSMSDGSHTLLDIAERAGLPFATLKRAADALESKGLLARAHSPGGWVSR